MLKPADLRIVTIILATLAILGGLRGLYFLLTVEYPGVPEHFYIEGVIARIIYIAAGAFAILNSRISLVLLISLLVHKLGLDILGHTRFTLTTYIFQLIFLVVLSFSYKLMKWKPRLKT